MKNEFKLEQYAQKAGILFKESRDFLAKSKSENLRNFSSGVPSSFIDNDKKITVVFAGQYSAGKSTILSLLTGKKLKIGGGVTTSETQELNWNGITVIDTPGIHTQKHPDHDRITYDAIAKADLIIFVVTAEGFSSHLAEHFRKLVFNAQKGSEMMLVVNKMNKTQMGNTKEQQDIVLDKNISPVIKPYSVEDLYTCCMDAGLYEEAQTESDEEEKNALKEESGFEDFIDNLNRFVKDKNLLGRCTTNLYILEQVLTEAISSIDTGDEKINITKHALSKQKRILRDSSLRIKDKVYNCVREETQQISRWGNEIANNLSSKDKEEEVNNRLKKKFEETDNVQENIIGKIKEIFAEENEKLQKDFDDFEKSQFGQMFNRMAEDISRKINAKFDPGTLKTVKTGSDKVVELANLFNKWTKGTNAKGGFSNILRLGEYSGSGTHKAVLEIGHFFGHKFRPWEAVKITKKIGVGFKVLGAAGAVIGIIVQIKSDNDEEKMDQQLLECRSQIRSKFSEVADVIDMRFDKDTQMWVENNINAQIKDLDKKMDELDQLVMNRNEDTDKLKNLLNRTRMLIEEIQRSQDVN